MQVGLHDGRSEVTSLGVVMILRDNADYTRTFMIPTFTRIEKLYPSVQFSYFIMENDSKDDTPELLRDFMKDRKGLLVSEKLDLAYEGENVNFARIARIAHVRNMLLRRMHKDGCLRDLDWCLFVDSELYFDELIIANMFASQPKVNNIGMVTCKAISLIDRKLSDSSVQEHERFVTQNHYYDTYAFVDAENIMYYPACVFPHCERERCHVLRGSDLDALPWKPDSKLVDVRSAWGGVVLIDARALEHPAIGWKPLLLKDFASLCEHIYFCDVLSATSGKRIVVCNSAECYWKTDGV